MAELPKTDIEMHKRFMREAIKASRASNCIRPDRIVGTVAVYGGKVLIATNNGTCPRVAPCSERGGRCIRHKLGVAVGTQPGLSWCLCGEQRLVAIAARNGISIKDSIIYCTHRPCIVCTKLLAECGVKEIFYETEYPDEMAKQYAEEIGLAVTLLRP